MMLYAPILLSALLAMQGDGIVQEPGSSTWGDVELPVGFYLDLATGMVSNQAPQDPMRGLTWDGDSLQGPALLTLTPGASERDVLTRGEGGELRPEEAVFLDTALLNTALLNTEWTYELGELGWGYLRALEVEAGRISLERAHRDVDQIELSRIPTEISWSSEGEGIELSWPQHSEEGARWFVERRELSSGVNTAWSSAGVSLEPAWTDEEAKPDVVYEYRAILAGNGWGARVRAVAGGMLDELIEASQGVGVNALSGEVDGARSDLRVEFINPKGVQISPGAGVEMRTLTQSGRDAWEVPSNDVPGYGPQRYFISEGRDLALHLPEGIYARVSLSKIEDGKAELRINVDLDGGRVLLPTPTLKSAEWLVSGEVKVRGSVLSGHESLGLGEPSMILEVERGYLSEEWSIVTESALSEAESLLDPDPGKAGLRRYRVRARIGSHRPSAPSAPVSILLGDDGGRGAEEWIREAVDELGKPDYSRRQRAREVLAVIGARARPFLLDVVSSSNPEQAAAARELLSDLGETEESAEAVEMHLPEVLMKRASELGLTEERLPGFLDPDPALRALAVFKAIDPESVRAHLELLADSDSEGFVREAAEIALSLPTRRMEPGQISTLHPEALSAISEELDAFGAPDVGLLADSFFAAAAGLDAWQVLVSFQVAMDLRASRGSALDEDAAIRRARLVLALLSEGHERGDAPDSFLAAALDVVATPLARQEAGRALAVKVFAARESIDEPLRVAAGDFSDLASILDACRRSGKGEQVIIPEGVYEASGGGLSSLRLGGQGVHLIGEGDVRIHASLLIEAGSKLTVENLHIEPRSGIGISITDGELTLIDTHLILQSMGIQATNSLVSLSGCLIANPSRSAGSKGGAMAMRFVGMSALIARNTQISSSASCVHGARFVFLDTCAFMARDRCAIEGQGALEVFIERSLLYGGYAALSGPSSGVIDGAVLESPGSPALRVGERLHLCAEHTRVGDEDGELWKKGHLVECTFGQR